MGWGGVGWVEKGCRGDLCMGIHACEGKGLEREEGCLGEHAGVAAEGGELLEVQPREPVLRYLHAATEPAPPHRMRCTW